MIRRNDFSAMMALWITGLIWWAGQADAKPAVEVNLASTTAWTFRPTEEDAQVKTLPVPAGGWRLNGFPNATAGTYERRIEIPRLPGGAPQTTFVEFEAVNWEATVFIGQDAGHLQEVGKHLSPWTPFRVDISRAAAPGSSALLRVFVRDRTYFKDAQGKFTVPAATEWNDRQARGILRGVALRVYPAVSISDVFVKTSTVTNTLTYEVTLTNATGQAQSLALSGSLSPVNTGAKWNYPALPPQTIKLEAGETKKVTVGPVGWTPGRASWWWPNVPFRPDYRAQLHSLTLQLWKGSCPDSKERPLNTETVRFGFCTPGQKGHFYTLNGIRINLRGDSLPEGTLGTDAFARLPGFLPPSGANSGWPGAVRNYQKLNFNVIRMHQVPCTRYMMDVCDALGLLVIPETAIRGGGSRIANLTALPDSYRMHLQELILRDRNHPSVFKWSLENELFGAPEPFMRGLYETCMETDGTRPCSIDDGVPGLPVDYPSYPRFAVIEHYTQPPGTPEAAGGAPRTDRPFGQGEYVWPQGATPQGPIWFGLTTRALRAHDNADVRPYTFIDVWPGVIPGLTPTNFPDPHLPPDSLEQGGRSLLNSPDPWRDPRLRLIQRSFAPVAAYDREYDIRNTPSTGLGEWPSLGLILPSGKTTTRQLIVFNDEFSGQKLKVRLQPTLILGEEAPRKLPEIVREVTVPLGGHVALNVDLPVPTVTENRTLEVTLTVLKDGQERYQERMISAVVPEKGGTTVRFEGRDNKTRGNWSGIYGKQGFMIPVFGGRSNFQMPDIYIQRGVGIVPVKENRDNPLEHAAAQEDAMYQWEKKDSVDDPRIPFRGPGMTERSPMAFRGNNGILYMRVDAKDSRSHRLSVYLLDYKRTGKAVDVDILDLAGNRLETRLIDNFGDGSYLNYQFTGSVVIRVVTLPVPNAPPNSFIEDPALSGLFVDAEKP